MRRTTQWRRANVARVLALATGDRILSWPVLVSCTVLSVLIHLAPNGNTVSGSVFVRVVVAVLACVPALSVIAGIHVATRRMPDNAWRTVIRIVSYFLGGAVRGIIFAFAFFWLGMSTGLNLDFRISGSAIPFGLAIAAATYAGSALSESRSRIIALRALQDDLQDAMRDSLRRNTSLRAREAHRVATMIRARLTDLHELDESVTSEQLVNLAEHVVRPLSHSLADRVAVWESDHRPAPRLRWRDIVTQLQPQRSLQPGLLATLSTATALTAFIYFFGIALAIPLVICSFVMLYLSIWTLQRVARLLAGVRNAVLRALLMTVLLVVAAVPAGVVDFFVLHGEDDPTFVLRGGIVVVPIFGWFIAIGSAAQAESLRVEEEHLKAIEELSWLKARINLVSWFEQGQFARILHGPVQSAINKGIVRLSKQGTAQARKRIVETIRREALSALDADGEQYQHSQTLDDMIDGLRLTWQSLCQIDISIGPGARSALAEDRPCSSICWEIIHESCANAIRHGKATWVSIRVLEPLGRVVELDIIDNGREFDNFAIPGMGTKVLEACALSWSRAREAEQTNLRATLPVVRPESEPLTPAAVFRTRERSV